MEKLSAQLEKQAEATQRAEAAAAVNQRKMEQIQAEIQAKDAHKRWVPS
jgi:hypothetical protein